MRFDKFLWQKAIVSCGDDIESSTKLLLLTLSTYMNKNGRCWPSIKTLAKNMLMQKRTVLRHIEVATKQGWLNISKNSGQGQGWKRNLYQANFPAEISVDNTEEKTTSLCDDIASSGNHLITKTHCSECTALKNDVVHSAHGRGVMGAQTWCSECTIINKEYNREEIKPPSPLSLNNENHAEAKASLSPCSAKPPFKNSMIDQKPKTSAGERFESPSPQIPPVLPSPKPDKIPYEEIVDYLNKAAGKQLKPKTKATRRFIKARWEEGYRLDDFRRVIDAKASQWKNDPDFDRYLRPRTLFSSKFEDYLNEKPKDPKQHRRYL